MSKSYNVCCLPGRYSHFLWDVGRFLHSGLLDLGRESLLSYNQASSKHVNLFIGTHQAEFPGIETLLGDSIIIETEALARGMINNNPLSKEFLEKSHFPLLRKAREVWSFCLQTNEYLLSLGVRSKFFRLGFSQRMLELKPQVFKPFDFVFYGSLSEERREVLDALANAGYKVGFTFDAPGPFRNNLISSGKISLCPKGSFGDFNFPRFVYLTNNAIPLVAERGRGSDVYESFGLLAEGPEGFLEMLKEVINTPKEDRESLARGFMEKALIEMPMSGELTKILEL